MIAPVFGVASTVGSNGIGPLLEASRLLQVVISALAVSLSVAVISFLQYTQGRLKEMRRLLLVVEREMHLDNIVERVIVPAAEAGGWAKFRKRLALVYLLEIAAGIAAVAVLVLIWHGEIATIWEMIR